jgi:hypothetical protein
MVSYSSRSTWWSSTGTLGDLHTVYLPFLHVGTYDPMFMACHGYTPYMNGHRLVTTFCGSTVRSCKADSTTTTTTTPLTAHAAPTLSTCKWDNQKGLAPPDNLHNSIMASSSSPHNGLGTQCILSSFMSHYLKGLHCRWLHHACDLPDSVTPNACEEPHIVDTVQCVSWRRHQRGQRASRMSRLLWKLLQESVISEGTFDGCLMTSTFKAWRVGHFIHIDAPHQALTGYIYIYNACFSWFS